MKIQDILFRAAVKLLSGAAPTVFGIISRSPRLQNLAIDSIKNHDFFKRNVNFLEAASSLDRQASQSVASGSYYFDKVRSGLPGVSVIIPVHNAGEAFSDCALSLIKFTPKSAHIVVVDDLSDDSLVRSSVRKLKSHFPKFTLIKNKQNLGYTKSINLGFDVVGPNDVIVLNSDTVVTKRWVQKLQYVAHSQPAVATVTPLSNNAGVFSAPSANGEKNQIAIPHHDLFALTVSRAGLGDPIEVPTGNGFCMFITNMALSKLGKYDEEKFPRGYGEENDFCMRAYRAGLLNLVTDKTYIFHKSSQSFREEKGALIEVGVAKVIADFPEYLNLLPVYFGAQFSAARSRIERASHKNQSQSSQLRVLYIQPITGGGTLDTNNDLVRALGTEIDPYYLRLDRQTIDLCRKDKNGNLEIVESVSCETSISPIRHSSQKYDGQLLDFVFRYSIDLVHVEHLAWQSISWGKALISLGVPYVVSCHDYYAACPSHNLLDEEYKSCGGICTSGKSQCNVTLWPENLVPPLKNQFITRWRQVFGEFLEGASTIVTPSETAKAIMFQNFPNLREKIVTIPHGREWLLEQQDNGCSQVGPLKVLFPGNIGRHKGGDVIPSVIANFANNASVEFHFLGETQRELSSLGIQHGSYSRDDFPQRVRDICPDIAVIASVWEETFCHTLDECWAAGLPAASFDIGAVSERIRATGAGWVLDFNDPVQSLTLFIKQLLVNKDIIAEKRDLVNANAWPYLSGNSSRKMANHYLDIYSSAITGSQF